MQDSHTSQDTLYILTRNSTNGVHTTGNNLEQTVHLYLSTVNTYALSNHICFIEIGTRSENKDKRNFTIQQNENVCIHCEKFTY